MMDFQENILEQFSSFETTIQIVSQILIALFFLIEMMSIGQILHDSQKTNSLYIWLELGIKYGIIALLISSSSQIYDGVQWLTETVGVKVKSSQGIEYEFVVPETSPYFYKQFLTLLGDGLEVSVKSLQYYLLYFHKLEFILLKLVSPFFISCTMIKSLKSLTKKFLFFNMMLSMQYLCLNLSLKVLPKLFGYMQPELNLSERLTDLVPSYISIIQGIMILMTILSSYYLPRKLLV